MKIFDNARLKLTGWYVLVVMFLSIVFSAAIYQFQTREIERFEAAQRARIERRMIPGQASGFILIDEELIKEAKDRIFYRLLSINIIVIFAAGALGYYLSGRTLSPIVDMVAAQRRFVSDAAHELRTPLTAMRLSHEVFLRDRHASKKDAELVVQDSLKDIGRLQALTNSLLTLSDLVENNTITGYEPVDLELITKAVLARARPLAKSKYVKVTTKVQSLVVQGNEGQLHQLFMILIDNAIKYASEKSGRVEVKLAKVNRAARIQVVNNGIGIGKEDLPHIFDRFYRGDKARVQRDGGGYGLGLAIAKQIVLSHYGKITMKSRENGATIATVSIPLTRA